MRLISIAMSVSLIAVLSSTGVGMSQNGPRHGIKPWITAVAFTPDGKHILGGDSNGNIAIWEADSGKLLSRFAMATRYPVSAIAVTPDGRRALVGTRLSIFAVEPGDPVGDIALWDIPVGRLVKTLDPSQGVGTDGVAISPDGSKALTVGEEMLRMWDLREGTLLHNFQSFGPHVGTVVFLPDGKRALLEDKQALLIIALQDGKKETVLKRFHHGEDRLLALTADCRKGVLGRGDNLVLFDIEQWKIIETLSERTGIHPTGGPVRRYATVAMAPDGKAIVTSGIQSDLPGQILLWTAGGRDPARKFVKGGIHKQVNALAFSPDGRRVASGEVDGVLRIWNVGDAVLERALVAPDAD